MSGMISLYYIYTILHSSLTQPEVKSGVTKITKLIANINQESWDVEEERCHWLTERDHPMF